MTTRGKLLMVFRGLIFCCTGFVLYFLMCNNIQANLPNKLEFPHLLAKFDRNSIHVTYHRKLWQNLTTPTNLSIYLYGAYYDDRPPHNGKRFLQVLAVGALVLNPVYAVMWTEDTYRTNISSLCTAEKNGGGYRTSQFAYDQFFYSCEVKIEAIPKYVSLTFSNDNLQSNLMSVHIPERKRKNKFSVCVETGYGHINPYQIVEWVEANKYFGVTSISVYPCRVSESNMRIFRQFEKEGIMRVSYTPSPIGDRTWARQMTSSPISFNDCMLRQMYSADYIIPLDIDEIITPKNNASNYESLIKEIDQSFGTNESLPAYVFKMAYFFTTCGGVNKIDTMNMIRFIKKLPNNGAEKSFVNPRECLSVFNHFCLKFFENYSKPKNKRIDRKFGEVNHYRVAKSDEMCKTFNEIGIIDLHLKDKFAKDILIQYEKTVNRFRKLKLLPDSPRTT